MTTTLHNIIAADEALPALLDDDPLFMLDLPSEVVRKGKAVIRPPQLPEYVKHPAVLCIFDVKFNDVGEIWFYINDKNLQMERDRLQDRLNNYYGQSSAFEYNEKISNCTRLKMRSINAHPGQYCAVLDDNSWLRGLLVSNIMKGGFIEVRLIDVGLTKIFHVSLICFLVEQFFVECQQIYCGSLEIEFDQLHLISSWFLSVGVICANFMEGRIKLKLLDGEAKEKVGSRRRRRLTEVQKRFLACEKDHYFKVVRMFAEAKNGLCFGKRS